MPLNHLLTMVTKLTKEYPMLHIQEYNKILLNFFVHILQVTRDLLSQLSWMNFMKKWTHIQKRREEPQKLDHSTRSINVVREKANMETLSLEVVMHLCNNTKFDNNEFEIYILEKFTYVYMKLL